MAREKRCPLVYVGIVTSVVVLCSGCATEPTATATPTQTPEPTLAPTPTRPPTTEEELMAMISSELLGYLKEVIFDYQGNTETLFVNWDVARDSTNERIISGAQQDTVTILRAIAESNIDYQEVRLSGWYPVTIDINDNVEDTEVIWLYYDRSTLEELNWENVRSQYIWIVADRGSVHRLLQE